MNRLQWFSEIIMEMVNTRTTFASLSRNALVLLCKEQGIKGYTGKTKKDLMTLLQMPTYELRTEDTGKIFEKAICLAAQTPYDGNYKYSLERAQQLVPRISQVLTHKYVHTANKGSRYDFTFEEHHLSAKSTKKGCKVAPQVIGQAQPSRCCELLGIPYTSHADLKKYIQTHNTLVLSLLESYTFDCPILYYNEYTDTIRHITMTRPIEWEQYTYEWSRPWIVWNNSTTLKVVVGDKTIPLVEFQIHSKKRTNMAIRWSFENVLTIFQHHFTIVHV
jgi:hypothetical protein